jgi:hypothetical protein
LKIRIKTDAEADRYLNEMSREASISVEDLAEVAVYNLIALWVQERKQVEASGIVPDSAYDELVSGR